MRQDTPTARSRAHAGFRRIPWADYWKHPALSRSVLDKIRVSPLHLQHYLVHGDEDTPALVEGRVFHARVEAAVTGNADALSDRVAIWTGDRRAGKAWEEFQRQHEGRDIVRADDMERIERMADAVLRHPVARRLLSGASIEAAAFWRDDTGVECKALIDVVQDLMIYDLKTTSDIGFDAFSSSAFRYGYHRQAAWYLDGAAAASGRPFLGFGNIVVEKSAPFTVQVFHYADDAIARGRAENRANINLYAACKLANSWPGPGGDEPTTLELPRWA
jgi:hypothetical protein